MHEPNSRSSSRPRLSMQSLKQLDPETRSRFLRQLTVEQSATLLNDPRFHLRDAQLAPPGLWRWWLVLGGRGSGKSQAASVWLNESAAEMPGARFAIVCRTAADVRDVAVEGPAGVIETARRWFQSVRPPVYEPSKRRVTFASGATALCGSAAEPDLWRGPQFHRAWLDELGAWERGVEAWSNIELGLRLGEHPKAVVTTTPKLGSRVLQGLISDPSVVTTRMKTAENWALSTSTREAYERRWKGTSLAAQELEGQWLTESPGAIFKLKDIEAGRLAVLPAGVSLTRIVVAVDPAVSAHEGSDETGIVVAGRDASGEIYVLEDVSGRYSPHQWALAAVSAFDRWHADRIVAEKNMGGDLVEANLRSARSSVPITLVSAVRGKAIRAEPVASEYERHRVHHIGRFEDLEAQLVGWEPGDRSSPDRLDALVWAATELGAGSVFVCGPGGVDGPGMGGFDSRDGGLFTDFLGSDSR